MQPYDLNPLINYVLRIQFRYKMWRLLITLLHKSTGYPSTYLFQKQFTTHHRFWIFTTDCCGNVWYSTRWYYIKTVKIIIKLFTPACSPIILVFKHQTQLQNSEWGHQYKFASSTAFSRCSTTLHGPSALAELLVISSTLMRHLW